MGCNGLSSVRHCMGFRTDCGLDSLELDFLWVWQRVTYGILVNIKCTAKRVIKLNIANRLISFPVLHFPTFMGTKHCMHTLSAPSLATKHPRLFACTHSFPPTFLATKYSTDSLCQFLGNQTQCTHAFLASVLSTKHSTHATVKRPNH